MAPLVLVNLDAWQTHRRFAICGREVSRKSACQKASNAKWRLSPMPLRERWVVIVRHLGTMCAQDPLPEHEDRLKNFDWDPILDSLLWAFAPPGDHGSGTAPPPAVADHHRDFARIALGLAMERGVASPPPGWGTLGPACWARDGVKKPVGMQPCED